MNKLLLIICLFILLSTVVSAEEYKSGGIIELYKIPQCEGPVKIKVTSPNGISDNEMRIEKCTLKDNYIWDCSCSGGYFNVKLLTPSDTKNIYDFTIEYYLEYPKINDSGNMSPSIQEIQRDNYKRTNKLNNIVIQPGQPIKRLFKIDMQTKNAVLFSVLLFLFILGVFLFKGKDMFSKSPRKENNDVMSYKVTKDADMDDDVMDILNKIK